MHSRLRYHTGGAADNPSIETSSNKFNTCTPCQVGAASLGRGGPSVPGAGDNAISPYKTATDINATGATAMDMNSTGAINKNATAPTKATGIHATGIYATGINATGTNATGINATDNNATATASEGFSSDTVAAEAAPMHAGGRGGSGGDRNGGLGNFSSGGGGAAQERNGWHDMPEVQEFTGDEVNVWGGGMRVRCYDMGGTFFGLNVSERPGTSSE